MSDGNTPPGGESPGNCVHRDVVSPSAERRGSVLDDASEQRESERCGPSSSTRSNLSRNDSLAEIITSSKLTGSKDCADSEISARAEKHPRLAPSQASFGVIPGSCRLPKSLITLTTPSRVRYPQHMIKMAATSRTRKIPPRSSYVEVTRSRKLITWDEAMNSRPPLRIDMEGPTPCSYSPSNKPLSERNAPCHTFGKKTYVEKPGGARTSWEKTWFQTSDIWTQKTDFLHDRRWPGPTRYPQRPTLGVRQVSFHGATAFTIGLRRTPGDQANGQHPSPGEYDVSSPDTVRFPRAPSHTLGLRRGGTAIWSLTEETPGPGTYEADVSITRVKRHVPAFSIRGLRGEKQHDLGPFATL